MNVVRNLYAVLMSVAFLVLLAVPALAETTNEVEIVGTVTAMTPGMVVVNEQAIDLSQAEVKTTLALGAVVRVEGTLRPDGTILAREISAVADDDLQPGELIIKGVLEMVDGDFFIIGGQRITVADAVVEAGVAIGVKVEVYASVADDGTWVARKVELDDDDFDDSSDDDAEFEIRGTLEAIGDDSIVVGGRSIVITSAELKDPLVLGVLVKVKLIDVNGVLVAREVERTSSDDSSSDDSSDDSSNDDTLANPTISKDQAIQIILGIYPNTTIVKIELDDEDDRLVWEIKTSHKLEIVLDAETGVILTIDRSDDDRVSDSDDDDDREDNSSSYNDDDRDDDSNDDRDDDSNDDRGNDDDEDDDHGDDDDDD